MLPASRTRNTARWKHAQESRKCADLFDRHRHEIDGIIVTLPNFGEERGIADALRWSGLNVPVLVQATPDTPGRMTIANRRDSFCGKMSCCNNLKQYGIPYSLTTLHTEAPDSPEFAKDLDWFAAVCRVARGMRNLRMGAIGARPAAFNTVRYSEKILEADGHHHRAHRFIGDFRPHRAHEGRRSGGARQARMIQDYVSTTGIPEAALLKMAKLGAVVDEWMQQTQVPISAVQCWTSMEEYFGVVPCTVMSMMSNNLMSSACEVDICGRAGHARAAAGIGDAQRAARLEQQLRRRSR